MSFVTVERVHAATAFEVAGRDDGLVEQDEAAVFGRGCKAVA